MKREIDMMKKKGSIRRSVYNIYKQDKYMFFLLIFSIPITILLPIMQAYLPKIVIDGFEKEMPWKHLIYVVVSLFACIIALTIVQKLITSRIYGKQYNLSIMYQNMITKKHMNVFFETTEKKEYITKYTLAMNEACSGYCAAEFIWVPIQGLIVSILGFFTAINILTQISPIIVSVLLLNSFINFIYSLYLQKYTKQHKEEKADIDRKIGYLSNLSARFEIAKEIKIFNAFPLLEFYYKKYKMLLQMWNRRINFREFIGNLTNTILIIAKDGITYYLLVRMFLNGEIDVGDVVFFIGIIGLLYSWIEGIVGNITDISRQAQKAGYIFDYLEEPEKSSSSNTYLLEKSISVELNNVSYKYDNTGNNAIKDISISINAGEKVAIVGENGAGKTTLIKVLCGLYKPTSGQIKINNMIISECSQLYNSFSTVFQEICVLPVTIREFIISNKEYDKNLLKDVLIKTDLYDKVISLEKKDNTRIGKNIYEDGIDLSGGEKQKLLLARALYKNAPCLILDEPTAELDPLAESRLYRQYNELFNKKTLLFISHRLASTRFCDKIICMKDGEIIESGTHEQLMKNKGYYKELFTAQSKYYSEEAYDEKAEC